METSTLEKISSVHFEGDLIIIKSEEQTYKWKVSEISQKLSIASDAERSNFKISPAGYGIHWPQIDEDLSMHKGQKEDLNDAFE